jgi:hypothetical protein
VRPGFIDRLLGVIQRTAHTDSRPERPSFVTATAIPDTLTTSRRGREIGERVARTSGLERLTDRRVSLERLTYVGEKSGRKAGSPRAEPGGVEI